jgi:uncharacterized protein (DUF305 family)
MDLKFMQVIHLKAALRTVAFTAIVVSTAFLTACATDSQTQAQTADMPKTEGSSDSGKDHSGMTTNHGMDLGPADIDYDLRFIDAMIPHHEGAITMAQAALKNTKRPELRTLANEIIKAQAEEIAQMKQWRKAWYPKASTTPMAWHREMGHMMAMSSSQVQLMRMDMDLGKADLNFDRRFIQVMIPHHQGAITMANDLKQKTKRPELQKLAQNIIESQQAEISQMEQWLQSWYKQ